jgi:hypothetical protein
LLRTASFFCGGGRDMGPAATCIATRAGAPYFDFAKEKLNAIGRKGLFADDSANQTPTYSGI